MYIRLNKYITFDLGTDTDKYMMHKPHVCASTLKFRFSEKATKIWNYHPLGFDNT